MNDGTVLLTLDLRASEDAGHTEDGSPLPPTVAGSYPHVFRSTDGGRSFGEGSLITMHAGETHLLQLSGVASLGR